MKQMLMAAAAALLMAGCTSFHVERDTQLAPTMSDYSSNPYYIDYSIKNDRAKGTGTASCWFWWFVSSDGKFAPVPSMDLSRAVRAAKASATYDALENGNADALMGALYRYKVKDYFVYQKIECEATGFPANMKSVNMIQDKPTILPNDVQIVRLKPWETLNTDYERNSVKAPVKRAWYRWLFFGLF